VFGTAKTSLPVFVPNQRLEILLYYSVYPFQTFLRSKVEYANMNAVAKVKSSTIAEGRGKSRAKLCTPITWHLILFTSSFPGICVQYLNNRSRHSTECVFGKSLKIEAIQTKYIEHNPRGHVRLASDLPPDSISRTELRSQHLDFANCQSKTSGQTEVIERQPC
jgi:hypothetical protein